MAKDKATTSDTDNGTHALMTTEGIPGLGIANDTRRAQAMAKGRLLRQIVTMQEGSFLEGRLVGPGAPIDVKAPDGETSACRTWDFDMGNGITVGILGSHQLDSELPHLVGHRLYVEKYGTKKVGSRQVNQWCVVDLGLVAVEASA